MTHVLTTDQMKSAEGAAIGSGRITGLELMERAAAVAANEIASRFGEDAEIGRRAAVLSGPGNNGGDGYGIATLLAERGWDVTLWAFGDPKRLTPEAAAMRMRWLAIGEILDLERFSSFDCTYGHVTVDAMFGTGLRRPIGRQAIRALGGGMGRGPVVAVDILSGLNSDTGEFMCEECFSPEPVQLTVTFQCAKPGHFLREGGRLSGDVSVQTIGIENEVAHLAAGQDLCRRIERADISSNGLLKMNPTGHKYGHGHVLVLSGGSGRGGAARLAARAALRVGAGLVTIGVEQAGIAEHASQLNAIMLRPVDDPEMLTSILSDPRINCICAGPGLGINENSKRLVETLLKSGRKLVLDADALGIFKERSEEFRDAMTAQIVMTPHAGEFRQLFPDLHDRVWERGTDTSKLVATAAAARRTNATIVHKGHDTVVATPDGGVSLVPATGHDAAPWLATAGSGDVLAGLISGLIARGRGVGDAACKAAWIHFAAARKFGPGLIAEDLPECVPAVLAELDPMHARIP